MTLLALPLPTAPVALLAGPGRLFHLHPHEALVARCEAVIDASGLGVWFEAELAKADTRAGGRRSSCATPSGCSTR